MTSIELRSQFVKKYTANGLVHRGCPKGQPAAIFDHSPFGFEGMFFDYE